MSCLVCNKDFSGTVCPRCGFPVVNFPGDPEEGIRQLQPQINAFRAEFMKKVSVGVVISRWKDLDGYIALDTEEEKTFGTADALRGNTVWMEGMFARIPDAEAVEIRARVTAAGDTAEYSISVPNPHEPELQQLGIELDEDLSFSLLIRNSKTVTRSEKYPLFA